MVLLGFEFSHYKGYSCVFEQLHFPSESPVELYIAHHGEITYDYCWYNYAVYLEDALGTASRGGWGKSDLLFLTVEDKTRS